MLHHQALIAVALALTASLANAQQIEAESTYFTHGTVIEDPAGAGTFVALEPGGSFVFEVESTAELPVLLIRARSFDGDSAVTATIDPDTFVAGLLHMGPAGETATTGFLLPNLRPGPHMVTVTYEGSEPAWFDAFELNNENCAAGPCGGCDIAPTAAPYARSGKTKVKFPPLPGGKVAKFTTKILGLLTVTATSIEDAYLDQARDGGCWIQKVDCNDPNSVEKCLPSNPSCKARANVKFTPNNYARPPFWDMQEDMTYPDGSAGRFNRDSTQRHGRQQVAAACGKGETITFEFEHGGVVVMFLSCNKCD